MHNLSSFWSKHLYYVFSACQLQISLTKPNYITLKVVNCYFFQYCGSEIRLGPGTQYNCSGWLALSPVWYLVAFWVAHRETRRWSHVTVTSNRSESILVTLCFGGFSRHIFQDMWKLALCFLLFLAERKLHRMVLLDI